MSKFTWSDRGMDLERRCTELHELASKNILNEEEIKVHIKHLVRLNNRLQRRDATFEDFSKVIGLETSFSVSHKNSFGSAKAWAKAMVPPLFRQHVVALNLFSQDPKAYIAFFIFCREFEWKKCFSKYSSKSLSLLSNCPDIFVEISRTYLSLYHNFDYSRKVLLHGLKRNPNSIKIWSELIALEINLYKAGEDPERLSVIKILVAEAKTKVPANQLEQFIAFLEACEPQAEEKN